MTLLRALGLVFQLQSLMLVALSTIALTLVLAVGGAGAVIAIPAIYILIVWINKYAFVLLDTAANGETKAPVASVEMLGPFSDARSWAMPVFGTLVAIAAYLLPEPARLPVFFLALLIAPLLLAALATTDSFLAAFNPLAWWRALQGLAAGFLVILGAVLLSGIFVIAASRLALRPFFAIGLAELLFLCVYALTGGVVHARREALGFSPRHSPERESQRRDAEREAARQKMIDEVFVAVRARKDEFAKTTLTRWLEATEPRHIESDIGAIVTSGARWNEPRGFAAIVRHLIGWLCLQRRPGPALGIVEQVLPQAPTFAPESLDQTVMLVRYAVQTSRRRLAQQLLANALEKAPGDSRPALEALQREIAR